MAADQPQGNPARHLRTLQREQATAHRTDLHDQQLRKALHLPQTQLQLRIGVPAELPPQRSPIRPQVLLFLQLPERRNPPGFHRPVLRQVLQKPGVHRSAQRNLLEQGQLPRQ